MKLAFVLTLSCVSLLAEAADNTRTFLLPSIKKHIPALPVGAYVDSGLDSSYVLECDSNSFSSSFTAHEVHRGSGGVQKKESTLPSSSDCKLKNLSYRLGSLYFNDGTSIVALDLDKSRAKRLRVPGLNTDCIRSLRVEGDRIFWVNSCDFHLYSRDLQNMQSQSVDLRPYFKEIRPYHAEIDVRGVNALLAIFDRDHTAGPGTITLYPFNPTNLAIGQASYTRQINPSSSAYPRLFISIAQSTLLIRFDKILDLTNLETNSASQYILSDDGDSNHIGLNQAGFSIYRQGKHSRDTFLQTYLTSEAVPMRGHYSPDQWGDCSRAETKIGGGWEYRLCRESEIGLEKQFLMAFPAGEPDSARKIFLREHQGHTPNFLYNSVALVGHRLYVGGKDLAIYSWPELTLQQTISLPSTCIEIDSLNETDDQLVVNCEDASGHNSTILRFDPNSQNFTTLIQGHLYRGAIQSSRLYFTRNEEGTQLLVEKDLASSSERSFDARELSRYGFDPNRISFSYNILGDRIFLEVHGYLDGSMDAQGNELDLDGLAILELSSGKLRSFTPGAFWSFGGSKSILWAPWSHRQFHLTPSAL